MAFLLGLVLGSLTAFPSPSMAQIDLCSPPLDPCLPGGKYDPLLGRCMGYNGEPCFACLGGETCTEKRTDCLIEMSGGDPMFLDDYWENVQDPPCTSIAADYRMNYQGDDSEILLFPLEQAIRRLHQTVKNVQVEGYEVVPGYGALNVIDAALFALTELGDQDSYRVLAQPPYYAKYPETAENGIAKRRTRTGHAVFRDWNLSAEPTSNSTIEILCLPNNPSGEIRPPLVNDRSRIIADLAYSWPAYMDLKEPWGFDIMVFTNSKHSGHAGTRFGWALVKDPRVASLMRDYLLIKTNSGLSIDIQLKTLSLFTWIAEHPGFYDFGREEIKRRWDSLTQMFAETAQPFVLENREVRGPFAWIRCQATTDCQGAFRQAGIKVANGANYGSDSTFVRMNMMARRIENDEAFRLLKSLLRV